MSTMAAIMQYVQIVKTSLVNVNCDQFVFTSCVIPTYVIKFIGQCAVKWKKINSVNGFKSAVWAHLTLILEIY